MPKPTKPKSHPCQVHVEAPPGSKALHLCFGHYAAWRDGPREGPATVVSAAVLSDAWETCSTKCAGCVDELEAYEQASAEYAKARLNGQEG